MLEHVYNLYIIVYLPGKMNMMVWGKQCWYSNPESLFPLSNVLHVVLSTKLK